MKSFTLFKFHIVSIKIYNFYLRDPSKYFSKKTFQRSVNIVNWQTIIERKNTFIFCAIYLQGNIILNILIYMNKIV